MINGASSWMVVVGVSSLLWKMFFFSLQKRMLVNKAHYYFFYNRGAAMGLLG